MAPDRGTTEQLDDELADDGPEAGAALAELVGAGLAVPCVDGVDRRYRDLDGAASTPATTSVAAKVAEFLPWYSSVHRGAGYKSRVATAAYEAARARVLEFAGRMPGGTGAAIGGGAGASGRVGDDVAVICRNATEAINHLAYRLPFGPGDVVVTTVVEHHANLLPWGRVAERRYVECSREGTFGVDDVTEVLDAVTKEGRRPALLA
ncbi:MAG TPA: aminotransferase class V-fold PLP-dependent enzyme, partial [Acidimicrobiales bacterium]